MRLRTLWELAGGRNIRLGLQAARMMEPVHRMSWLAAASRHGLLRVLGEGPATFDALAQTFVPDPRGHEAFRAWLRHGCALGLLRLESDAYRLHGLMARRLADPENDRFAAFVEALASVHHRGLYETMDRITAGDTFALTDLDGPLVARVAELLAPLLREVVDEVVPASGPVALLDLGCGGGAYIRHACEKSPELRAVGVDFDPHVADAARETMRAKGLDGRVEIVADDIRSLALEQSFDVVVAFNLIYYFREDERPRVLATIADHVAQGGKLVLTSSCRGGTIGNNIMDVWFSAIPQCGPLPTPETLCEQLKAAGLRPDAPRRLVPREEYYLFVAHR